MRTEQEEEDGWSNALREFELIEASVNDSRAAIINMVALDENGEPITVEAQVLADAVAQLVFTATGFHSTNRSWQSGSCRMGPAPSYQRLEGDTEEVVNRDDFVNYTAEWVPPTTTVAPTSTTAGQMPRMAAAPITASDSGEERPSGGAQLRAGVFQLGDRATSGTRTIVPPWKATIEPKSRSAIALTASMPYQLESARSNEVGCRRAERARAR